MTREYLTCSEFWILAELGALMLVCGPAVMDLGLV